jgi:hypothetical protein
MVAWGLVEYAGTAIYRALQEEASRAGYLLRTAKVKDKPFDDRGFSVQVGGSFTLLGKTRTGRVLNHTKRPAQEWRRLTNGTLQQCCLHLLTHIDPENYPTDTPNQGYVYGPEQRNLKERHERRDPHLAV